MILVRNRQQPSSGNRNFYYNKTLNVYNYYLISMHLIENNVLNFDKDFDVNFKSVSTLFIHK